MAENDFDRVQRNIGRLIEQKAPTADIEAYLASEGFGGGQPKPSLGEDMLKSAGTGLAEGAISTIGIPGDALNLAKSGWNKIVGQEPKPMPAPADFVGKVPSQEPLLKIPGSAEIKTAIQNKTGPFYQPQTVPGEYARTTASFVPAAVAGPGGIARRAIQQVAIPALASETAGQLYKGTPNEGVARAVGGLAGAAGPVAAGRIVTPLPASPERNALVNTLQNEGVTSLTAGQRTGSKPLQWMEQTLSDLPMAGGGATRIANQGKEQFTEAALRRVGEQDNRASPEVMDRALTRIGNQFDTLAARNDIRADRQLFTDLTGAVNYYQTMVAPSQQVPIVNDVAQDVVNWVRNQHGQITGTQYQDLRSRLGKAQRSTNDPALSEALHGMRTAVDDAMERSIPANSPDRQAWQQARREYRNVIPLEHAAAGAGADTAEGLVSPAQLRSAVAMDHGRRAYVRGQGDYADLARAGAGVMAPLPNSGTAPRSFMQALLTGAGLASTAGAPIAAGRAVTSPLVQAYLGNQLLSPLLQNTGTTRNVLAQALLSPGRKDVREPPQ